MRFCVSAEGVRDGVRGMSGLRPGRASSSQDLPSTRPGECGNQIGVQGTMGHT